MKTGCWFANILKKGSWNGRRQFPAFCYYVQESSPPSTSIHPLSLKSRQLIFYDDFAPCGLRCWPFFFAGCRKRRLNHALSVCLFCLVFRVSVVLITKATFWVVLFCVIYVFCLLVVLLRLSVAVQVIDWKVSSSKWTIMCWWGTYQLIHSLSLRWLP